MHSCSLSSLCQALQGQQGRGFTLSDGVSTAGVESSLEVNLSQLAHSPQGWRKIINVLYATGWFAQRGGSRGEGHQERRVMREEGSKGGKRERVKERE